MIGHPSPREWPCQVCNLPGHTVTNRGEPCEDCQRDAATWDDPGVPTPTVHEILPPRYRDRDNYDAMQDERSEHTADTRPTIKELLARDLETHHCDTYVRRTNVARHPFGLPTGATSRAGMTPDAAARPFPSPGPAAADGSDLPNAA